MQRAACSVPRQELGVYRSPSVSSSSIGRHTKWAVQCVIGDLYAHAALTTVYEFVAAVAFEP